MLYRCRCPQLRSREKRGSSSNCCTAVAAHGAAVPEPALATGGSMTVAVLPLHHLDVAVVLLGSGCRFCRSKAVTLVSCVIIICRRCCCA
jgi:hypothetical protein